MKLCLFHIFAQWLWNVFYWYKVLWMSCNYAAFEDQKSFLMGINFLVHKIQLIKIGRFCCNILIVLKIITRQLRLMWRNFSYLFISAQILFVFFVVITVFNYVSYIPFSLLFHIFSSLCHIYFFSFFFNHPFLFNKFRLYFKSLSYHFLIIF